MPLSTSRDAGSELLCLHSINTDSEWAVASRIVNLLPGRNTEGEETRVHIHFLQALLHPAVQGSPGLSSQPEQINGFQYPIM